MDYEYLTTTCQYSEDFQPIPVSCGKPAVARIWWDGDGEMLVCQEHLNYILQCEKDLAEAIAPPTGE